MYVAVYRSYIIYIHLWSTITESSINSVSIRIFDCSSNFYFYEILFYLDTHMQKISTFHMLARSDLKVHRVFEKRFVSLYCSNYFCRLPRYIVSICIADSFTWHDMATFWSQTKLGMTRCRAQGTSTKGRRSLPGIEWKFAETNNKQSDSVFDSMNP